MRHGIDGIFAHESSNVKSNFVIQQISLFLYMLNAMRDQLNFQWMSSISLRCNSGAEKIAKLTQFNWK